MTRTGTIKLIYKENAINQLHYNGPESRNRIINTWRNLYGEAFENCALQIRPDITDNHKYDTSKKLIANYKAHRMI
jgi:hypothetical protein